MLNQDFHLIDDVSIEESFRYLTENDWRLMMEKARQIDMARHEVIIEEGNQARNIYLLISGSARIERTRRGSTKVLSRLSPGNVFGEISFVDQTGAPASVIAEEPSRLEVIGGDHVVALFASIPGFATRFYMSVAATLAIRLRATSELLANR
jgi:extracellular factor (EF) 3-hydroxypalmitic acid methyl ester biosynthesis protein